MKVNFAVYKALSERDRFFADLLIHIGEAVEALKPEFVGVFDDDSNLGPLAGTNEIPKIEEKSE